MYQGRHHKRSRGRSGKSIALLVSLLLIIGVTVGGTIAFLMDTDGPLHNLFNPSRVTTRVEETLDGTTKKHVYIKNTGDTDAWIRAAVVITWQDKDGNVYGKAPAAADYMIDYGAENGWVQGADGFWYYTSPVAAGKSTNYLIDSCTVVGNAPDANYFLNVEVIGSGIQSNPPHVVEAEWASGIAGVSDTDMLTVKQGGAGE